MYGVTYKQILTRRVIYRQITRRCYLDISNRYVSLIFSRKIKIILFHERLYMYTADSACALWVVA